MKNKRATIATALVIAATLVTLVSARMCRVSSYVGREIESAMSELGEVVLDTRTSDRATGYELYFRRSDGCLVVAVENGKITEARLMQR